MDKKPLSMPDYLEKCDKNYDAIKRGVVLMEQTKAGVTTNTDILAQLISAQGQIIGLSSLLMAKGILTQAEVQDAILNGMAEEILRIENRLSDATGQAILL